MSERGLSPGKGDPTHVLATLQYGHSPRQPGGKQKLDRELRPEMGLRCSCGQERALQKKLETLIPNRQPETVKPHILSGGARGRCAGGGLFVAKGLASLRLLPGQVLPQCAVLVFTIGAYIITDKTLGVPCHIYSIMGPKPYSN